MVDVDRHETASWKIRPGHRRLARNRARYCTAERGAAVAVNFLQNEPAALDTVARIKSGGGEAFAVQGNVAHPDELAAMVRNVKERFGALDIFVHNALGDLLGFMSPPLQVTLEQWNAALECQQQAFLVGVQTAAPLCATRDALSP